MSKSDDGKTLFLSKIAEMENRLKDFQKKELLPLISKSDDSKALFLSKITEMETRLKDFQKKELLPLISKSDDSKALFLSKIAEMEDNLKDIQDNENKLLNKMAEIEDKRNDFQENKLLPLILKDDDAKFYRKIEAVEKNIQNNENKFLNKLTEIENQLKDSQKRNEKIIEVLETDRLAASEKQALTYEVIEVKIKELLNAKLDGIGEVYQDNVKELSDKFVKGLGTFCGKMNGNFFKMFEDIKAKFNRSIFDMSEQLSANREEDFKLLLSETKSELKSAVKTCFSDERKSFRKDMEDVSLKFEDEYKKLNERQDIALNNSAKTKADLQSMIQKHFSDERELFKKEMEDTTVKFIGEHKKLDEMQGAVLDGAAKIKVDLQFSIKKHFNDERELFKKEMEDFSFKIEREYKKLTEIQTAASDNAFEIKTDVQYAIKKHFADEKELFRKEMEEIKGKFLEDYEKMAEIQIDASDNASKIKADVQYAIKKHFTDERELFRKEMEEVKGNFLEDHEKMAEIQAAASDNASKIKADVQYAIKKHFTDERELFRKEMEEVTGKFLGEYRKLDKMLNRLNNMSTSDDKIEEFLEKMKVVIAETGKLFLNEANVENKKHLSKIKDFCSETSQEMFSVETISFYLDSVHDKALNTGKNLENLVKEIDELRFEPILGSAGITIKREFESLRNSLLELRKETQTFNDLRNRMEQVAFNQRNKNTERQ